jgi:hypothetical protein
MQAAFILLLLALTPPQPDTLVVCPTDFRPALESWIDYRRGQGHVIAVVDPPHTAAQLHSVIRGYRQSEKFKHLVITADVPEAQEVSQRSARTRVPTNYVGAKINIHWGSERTIATDTPYADIDGDGSPDLAVGRIPADSPDELAAFVRKVIEYEQTASTAQCSRQLDVVAGAGGFGAISDTLIEAAGRNVIRQVVPVDYDVRHTSVKPETAKLDDVRAVVRRQLTEGGLAWIYLGHGLPLQLDGVYSPAGTVVPLMTTDDVPNFCCNAQPPLAVLVACYTGAFDAKRDSLAEELALSEDGPIAVIAATRVTMPYGNTVLGYELLRACFNDRPHAFGNVLKLAQCRTLKNAPNDPLRPSLDGLAQGLSPAPIDLPAERSEHVMMYHLFGDPLLRLRLPDAGELANTGSSDSRKPVRR